MDICTVCRLCLPGAFCELRQYFSADRVMTPRKYLLRANQSANTVPPETDAVRALPEPGRPAPMPQGREALKAQVLRLDAAHVHPPL